MKRLILNIIPRSQKFLENSRVVLPLLFKAMGNYYWDLKIIKRDYHLEDKKAVLSEYELWTPEDSVSIWIVENNCFRAMKFVFRRRLLLSACKRGNLKMVQFMSEKGMPMQIQHNYGLPLACSGGYLEVAKFLVEKGVEIQYNSLETAIDNRHLNIVRFLVEKDKYTCRINLGLVRACYRGYLEIVKCLLENGTDIHTENDMPLLIAYQLNNFEIFKFLVANGADIFARDTIFWRAIWKGGWRVPFSQVKRTMLGWV